MAGDPARVRADRRQVAGDVAVASVAAAADTTAASDVGAAVPVGALREGLGWPVARSSRVGPAGWAPGSLGLSCSRRVSVGRLFTICN